MFYINMRIKLVVCKLILDLEFANDNYVKILNVLGSKSDECK